MVIKHTLKDLLTRDNLVFFSSFLKLKDSLLDQAKSIKVHLQLNY